MKRTVGNISWTQALPVDVVQYSFLEHCSHKCCPFFSVSLLYVEAIRHVAWYRHGVFFNKIVVARVIACLFTT